jgi:type II secretory pathway pseudopilin PulG
MNLYVIAIVAALAAFGSWQVQNWRAKANEADRIEAQHEKERMDRRAVDNAASGHEADKVRIRTVTKVIEREVANATRTEFYAADAPACLDADGLRIVAQSLGRAPAASEPARTVRGPGPAR